jgi:site-specific DNA recombinase
VLLALATDKEHETMTNDLTRQRQQPPGGRPAGAQNGQEARTTGSDRRRAVAYLRRALSGSFQAQLRAINRYAGAQGLEVMTGTADVGRGDSLAGRDGLAETLRLVADGVVDVVLVARLDRISGDVATQEVVRHLVASHGGELVSAAGEATTEPERLMIRSTLALSDQARTLLHSWRKRAEAKRRHPGAAPYGSQLVDGELVDHPDEQVTRARMVELRAEGLSLAAVGRQLDAEGHRTRNGRPWQARVIADILRRIGGKSEGS